MKDAAAHYAHLEDATVFDIARQMSIGVSAFLRDLHKSDPDLDAQQAALRADYAAVSTRNDALEFLGKWTVKAKKLEALWELNHPAAEN